MYYRQLVPMSNGLHTILPSSPLTKNISNVEEYPINCIGYENTIHENVPALLDTNNNVWIKESIAHNIFYPDSSD